METIDDYFSEQKFFKTQIRSTASAATNFQNLYIKDESAFKIKVNNVENYAGKHLENVASLMGKYLGMQTLITSDQAVCNTMQEEYLSYLKQTEFGLWINLGDAVSADSSNFYVRTFWNAGKAELALDERQAGGIQREIICDVLKFLEVPGIECPYVPVFQSTFTFPFCQTISPLNGNPHNITWFIDRIKDEEEKWPESERKNTKLMFTRLRKIFYGGENWNIIIPGAKDIKGTYEIVKIPYPGYPKEWPNNHWIEKVFPRTFSYFSDGFHFTDNESRPVDALGQSPSIYCDNSTCSNWNQEVTLDNGCIIDMGHVFTGIDAINYPKSSISPVWGLFSVPNNSAATWIGDIGSVIQTVQYQRDRRQKDALAPIGSPEIQQIIDDYASGADMLGNIDGYVIAKKYPVGSSSGMKVSQILTDYYLGAGKATFQSKRFSLFAESVGLIWENGSFQNEEIITDKYVDEAVNFAKLFTLGSARNFGSDNGGTGYGEAVKAEFAIVELSAGTWGSKKYFKTFFSDLKQKILSE